MESKYAKDAIHVCRLMFGQALLELLGENQPVTNAALENKVKAMLPDSQPEVVYKVAMKLLMRNVH